MPLIATLFMHLREPTELPLRGVTRFLWRQAFGELLLHATFEMLPHLLGHLGFEVCATEERAEFGDDCVHDVIRSAAPLSD